MSKELVISANRHETKVAVLEDDQLVEVYFQRANEYSLAGSIHKGRVTRVLPGMQSAFVDLGLERDTFLYVSDFFEENEEEFDRISGRDDIEGRVERARRPIAETRHERNVEGAPIAVEPAPSGVQAETEEPEAVEAERTEASESRDRRGRRSRRRRSRGRGFPESKYAGPESRESVAAPEGERAPQREEESGLPEFEVLPGESLAKYQRTPVAPLDESEAEEIEIAHDTAAAHGGTTASTSESGPEPSGPEQRDHLQGESEVSSDFEISHGAGTATALAPETGSAETETFALSEPPADEAEAEAELDEDLAAQAQSDAEAEMTSGTSPAKEIQNEPVPEPEVREAVAGSMDNLDEAAPRESSSQGSTTPQLTANVREQGGRYMHRMPRRMRRKMRGPGNVGAESRSSAEPERSDAVPALVDAVVSPKTEPARGSTVRHADRPASATTPQITDLLKEGQEIIVQIAKEPLGQKGARITSHIALPGRYVVYMPTLEHMGVSRKVSSDEERQRLKRILQTHRAGTPGGFIIRTAGEGKSEEEISADMSFLFNLWMDIRQKAEKKPAPALLHHDLDIVQRTLRDQLTESFKAIWVDNDEMYESILRFVQRFQPALVGKVKLYTRPTPIFDAFNVTTELEKALRPKVWLKSGGYIVINQTEALVAIDVNTGKYVGKSNRLEDTIVKTNTEAVKEIVRQIRLRDLGGIIVVDFIDMDERKNRQKVMQALEEAMRADRAPNKILQFNDFGLVAITRKRVKQSLERTLCSPCPYCDGAGYVKSVQTVIGEIVQEAHKLVAGVQDQKDVMLRVNPEVAKVLKSHHNKYLEELEEILRRPVLVKGDPNLHQEKFDLA